MVILDSSIKVHIFDTRCALLYLEFGIPGLNNNKTFVIRQARFHRQRKIKLARYPALTEIDARNYLAANVPIV